VDLGAGGATPRRDPSPGLGGIPAAGCGASSGGPRLMNWLPLARATVRVPLDEQSIKSRFFGGVLDYRFLQQPLRPRQPVKNRLSLITSRCCLGELCVERD
jgi:hypothetical protein